MAIEIEQIERVQQVQADLQKEILAVHLLRASGTPTKMNEYKRQASNYAQAAMQSVATGDDKEFAGMFETMEEYLKRANRPSK